ncbi:MAG: hypothetical protein GYB25_12420 [Rhodobacteraceae bacterium]|nr:hypothetical protein [Paracoccaceae bacterium]
MGATMKKWALLLTEMGQTSACAGFDAKEEIHHVRCGEDAGFGISLEVVRGIVKSMLWLVTIYQCWGIGLRRVKGVPDV